MQDQPLRPLSSFQQMMIAVGSVAMGVGMTINFVVVAPLARQAGLSEIEVAWILTLSAAIYALMIPRWGRLAEKVGRKRVMVFSLFAMGATNMVFVFALNAALAGAITGLSALLLLMFVRLWFGLLAPGLQPASMAAMTDATTAKNRAAGLGLLGAAMSLGSILGPVGAAVLAPIDALAPIWGSIILCWAVAVLLAFALPKTRQNRPEAGAEKPKPLSVKDPRIMPHLVFLFSYFVAVAMVQQSLGWFIEDRYAFAETASRSASEMSVLYTGIAFACLSAGLIATQFGVVQVMRPDPRKMLPLGLLLVGIGYILAVLLYPFWALCAAFVITGCGAGLTVPSANALGSLSVPPKEQGAAAGILSAAPPAGFIFGPMIGALLYTVSGNLPLIIAAIAMGVLAGYALMLKDRAAREGSA